MTEDLTKLFATRAERFPQADGVDQTRRALERTVELVPVFGPRECEIGWSENRCCAPGNVAEAPKSISHFALHDRSVGFRPIGYVGANLGVNMREHETDAQCHERHIEPRRYARRTSEQLGCRLRLGA